MENALVRGCTFLNTPAGDVIGAQGEGGVFTIHAGARALISDILYEDVRIEHFWDKIVDFRIIALAL